MNKKDYIYLLIITIIGVTVILLTLGFDNIYGSRTDWLCQHWVFADYFRQQFYATGDIFPNFAPNIGAGQNIYNFAYYGLLSPIILFSYFFPFVEMIDYIIITSILSVFVSTFLFYKWMHNNKFSSKICMITTTLFLLSSPLIFHSHRHIMFVNYIPFLILGLIGIDRYFNENKKILYIISTFLMIMTSYYYSVGGLITLTIYGIYKYFKINKKITFYKFINDGFKFIIPMIISILMAGVLLFPTLAVIIENKVLVQSNLNKWTLLLPRFSLDPLLYNPYCIGYTIIAFISLINSFFSKKKEQLILGILVSIFLFIPIFIYLLNGSLYLRAKVLIPFLPIIGLIIGDFLTDLFNRKVKFNLLFIVIVIISITLYISGYTNMEYYINLFITVIILFVYKYIKKDFLVYTPIIIIAFIVCLSINKADKLVTNNIYERIFNEDKERLIKETINNDNSFYRFNSLLDTLATVNKIYQPSYYQTSLYSSTYNVDYNNFFYDTFNNAVPYRNRVITAQSNNILFQTLMGVKYILSNNDVPIGYELIEKNGGVGVYKNDNVFPLGYVVTNNISYDDFSNLNYPHKLEALLGNVVTDKKSNNTFSSSIEDFDLQYTSIIGTNIDITKREDKHIIKVKEADKITLNLKEPLSNKIIFIKFKVLKSQSCNTGDHSIKINDITNKLTCKSWLYHNKNYNFEYTLSSPRDINKLVIKFSKGNYEITDIKTYIMDYNTIKGYVNKIDKMVVNVDKTVGDKIIGTIDVKSDGYFVTTLPYNKGFNIKLNGEKQSYERVNDGFVGFPIQKGHYIVEITYTSPLFRFGLFSSIIGLLGLLFIIFKQILRI